MKNQAKMLDFLKQPQGGQPAMQYLLELIPHHVGSDIVPQRARDGYFNATAMCRAASKNWADYRRLGSTDAFLGELSSDMGIPISEIVQSFRGGEPQLQGTWVHPDVAVHLAQWLSPKFAVQVSRWVREWFSIGKNTSYHLRRYAANIQNIPYGHFSMLQELMVRLIGPMETRGYVLPERLVPDISEGRMFCKFLRDRHKINTDALPIYWHRYEDGRIVPAKLYPIDLLPAFIRHFNEAWLPHKATTYFGQRDPKALEYLPYLLPPPKAA